LLPGGLYMPYTVNFLFSFHIDIFTISAVS
jgi:hypothetical protein